MFERLKSLFQKRLDPFERWNQEHLDGWDVFYDDSCIARLDYKRCDFPFSLFTLEAVTCDRTLLDYAFKHTAKRNPDPKVTFHNRRFSTVVSDGPFLANLSEDGFVHLRDFRIPGESSADPRQGVW